ncbi:hypothetical protein [Vallitalea guaymasensis]|uniref:hypothetical protein n=1 Tax=Vallitalea guaymasensis TaxID=1185412 RepID=UPI002352A8B9|nr:hypothetical protein [Vallitalea guaymasensis]
MESLQKKIKDLENKVIEQQKLNEHYNSILDERHNLINKCDRQKIILEMEINDVKRLNGFTFKNFVHTVSFSKERKLEKEEKEAVVARLKYDEYLKAIEDINVKIESIRKELDKYEEIAKEYLEVVNKKEKLIISQDNKRSSLLINANKKIKELEEKNNKIKKAYVAGENLRFTLKKTEKILEKADRLDVVQIRNGGLLDDKSKVDMDETLSYLYKIQCCLKKYYKYLNNISIEFSENIKTNNLLKYVNYWLEGMFENMMENKKFQGTLTRVAETKWDVIDINSRLHQQSLVVEEELINVIKEKETILGYSKII